MRKTLLDVRGEILTEEIVKIVEENFNGHFNAYICFYDAVWEWYLSEQMKEVGRADFRDYRENIDEAIAEDIVLDYDIVKDEYLELVDSQTINAIQKMYLMKKIGNINSLKALHKFNCVMEWKYENLSDGTIKLPDDKFLALHFVFLCNENFVKIFCKKNSWNDSELSKNILKYATLLEKLDADIRYDVIYEKMTGLNLSILLSDYLYLIRETMGWDILKTNWVIVGTGNDAEIQKIESGRNENVEYQKDIIKQNYTEIKMLLFNYVEIITKMPYIYGKIFFVNQICLEILVHIWDKRKNVEQFGWSINDERSLGDDIKKKIDNVIISAKNDINVYNQAVDIFRDEYGIKLKNDIMLSYEMKNIKNASADEIEYFKNNVLKYGINIDQNWINYIIEDLISSEENSYIRFKIKDKELLSEVIPCVLRMINNL